MKKKITLLFLLSIFLAFAASPALAAPEGLWTDDGIVATGFAKGSGSENDPYIITNGAEFAYLAQTVNSGDSYAEKYIKQSGDIDLSAHYWIPVGEVWSGARAFSGTFDGGDYKITGLELDSAKATRVGNLGLFAIVHDGSIKNTHLVGANVRGYYASSSNTAAGLVGSFTVNADVSSTVSNCSFEGTINGGPSIAGLVGGIRVNGDGSFSIRNCAVSGDLNSAGSAGGLVGIVYVESTNGSATFAIEVCRVNAQIYAGDAHLAGIASAIFLEAGKATIANCYVDGRLSGKDNDYVGGIAARIQSERYYGGGKSDLLITGCRVDAEVAGGQKYADQGKDVGGIVGYLRVYHSKGRVENCFSIGNITGYSTVGGIVGDMQALNDEDEDHLAVENCFSTGNVTGGSACDYVGGIVGLATGRSSIMDCYALGDISGRNAVGGIAGSIRFESMSELAYCYALGSVSGDKEVGGIVGRINYNRGTMVRNVALQDDLTGTTDLGRVIGAQVYIPSDDTTVRYNYANAAMLVDGEMISNGTDSDKNGADITLATARTQSWWRDTVGFSFGNTDSNPWVWDDTAKRPVLYFADLSGEPIGEGISTELPAGAPAGVSAVAADDLKTGSDSFASEDAVVDKISAQTEFDETSFGSDGTIQHSALAAVNGWGSVGAGEFTALPVFEAKTNAAGQVAAVSFKVVGAQLFANTAGSVKVMKVLSQSAYEAYTFIADAGGIADKTFAIQLDGNPAFLAANASISGVGDYRVVLFIRDGGTFDLDGAENARVLDPTVILDPQATLGGSDPGSDPEGDPSGSGSSGCSALGLGFAALALLPYLYRRRK